MSFVFLFIIGLGTGLSGAMIPGPLFLFTVSESLKKDAAVGLRIAVGHIVIEAAFVALIFYGFRTLVTSEFLMRIVSGIGGASLLGMGGILFRQSARMSWTAATTGSDFDYGSFLGGAFFSIISPGFLIWWATIGFTVVLKSLVFGFFGLAVVALGHWVADVAWHGATSYFVHKGKGHLRDGHYHGIVRLLALGLMVMGIYFLTGMVF